jgi:hypothetical protein
MFIFFTSLLDEFDAPFSLPLLAPRPCLIVNGQNDPRLMEEVVVVVVVAVMVVVVAVMVMVMVVVVVVVVVVVIEVKARMSRTLKLK